MLMTLAGGNLLSFMSSNGAAYSRVPLRDSEMLLTLYGTALAVPELAAITVGDCLAWRLKLADIVGKAI